MQRRLPVGPSPKVAPGHLVDTTPPMACGLTCNRKRCGSILRSDILPTLRGRYLQSTSSHAHSHQVGSTRPLFLQHAHGSSTQSRRRGVGTRMYLHTRLPCPGRGVYVTLRSVFTSHHAASVPVGRLCWFEVLFSFILSACNSKKSRQHLGTNSEEIELPACRITSGDIG